MNRWWWLIIFIAALGTVGAGLIVRGMIGDDVTMCGMDEAIETLGAAGIDIEHLTVMSACTNIVSGLREWEIREVVAVGSEGAVFEALRLSLVDMSQPDSLQDQGATVPDEFVLSGSPRRPPCRGETLSVTKDEIEFRDRTWERHMSWCQEIESENFMIGVILKTGSF